MRSRPCLLVVIVIMASRGPFLISPAIGPAESRFGVQWRTATSLPMEETMATTAIRSPDARSETKEASCRKLIDPFGESSWFAMFWNAPPVQAAPQPGSFSRRLISTYRRNSLRGHLQRAFWITCAVHQGRDFEMITHLRSKTAAWPARESAANSAKEDLRK